MPMPEMVDLPVVVTSIAPDGDGPDDVPARDVLARDVPARDVPARDVPTGGGTGAAGIAPSVVAVGPGAVDSGVAASGVVGPAAVVPGVVPDEVLVAHAGLSRVCEPPATALWQFVEREGPWEAWRAVIERRAPRPVLAGSAARVADLSWSEARRRAEADLDAARAVGAELLVPGDPRWPGAAVMGLAGAVARGVTGASPPLALWVRGRLPRELPTAAVTIVGSRACSPYGRRVAGELGADLVARGRVVVSGAAFGIDTAAHHGALAAHRPGDGPVTVAVLACGIDRAYPEANRGLLERIAADGAVVSEYPPGTRPARHRFLVRNRLIAAFGAGTVVVEAGRRSGTLSTAAAADHQGRTVMAVPGPVTSALSVGCHLLLADRFAQLVTGADDVLAALGGRSGGEPAGPDGAADDCAPVRPGDDPHHPTDGLDPDSARVYDALPTSAWAELSALVVEAGLVAATVLGALAVLELHDLVERRGHLWRRCRPDGRTVTAPAAPSAPAGPSADPHREAR